MAEPVVTRQEVRVAVGRASRQEFFLRYGGGVTISADDTSTDPVTVTASDLVQDTDYWQGDWAYLVDAGEERIIINSSSDGQLSLEYPHTNASTAGDSLEIWGMWPVSVVHDQINSAHRNAWQFFPNIVNLEQHIVVEDKIRYGLAASDRNNIDTAQDFPAVGTIHQLWIETSRTTVHGQVGSTNSATVFNDTSYLPDTANLPNSDWLVSFYDGPGEGQLREVVSVDTDGVFTIDTDLDVAVDTDSRYALWKPTERMEDWYRVTAANFDQMENPDWFEFKQLYPAAHGMRIRVVYTAQSTDFAADSDESTVPLEYLKLQTMSMLYASMVGDNRHDRAANAGQAEYYGQLAFAYAQQNGRDLPAMTLWAERDYSNYGGMTDQLNPMDWPGR